MAGTLSHHPDSETGDSPFLPGSGMLPPYLAGRETEQALIRRFLTVIAKRNPLGRDIVLYGPRGNGKTALIEWSRREAIQLRVPVADLQGGNLQTIEQLAANLSARKRWLGALRGLTLELVGIRLGNLPPGPVPSALGRRVRKGPFLILVDEAQMLGVEPGRSLLNAVQALRRTEVPVMLILAGTPDLPRHLSSMGASFWDRSRQLPLGRLRPAAAADAIRIPLEEHGRSIALDVLDEVVRESYGYPFFLQLWGDLLWTACSDPSAPASRGDLDRAHPMFEQERELYYDKRLDELQRAGLVSVAAKVAAEFSGAERVLRERVRIAIRAGLERAGTGDPSDRASIRKAERVLRHRGYIWPVVRQSIGYYEPGIPSLMRHVTLNERKNRESRDEAS